MANQKKVLIVAGGTGGHIFPALAIAQELTKQNISVEWLGTHDRLEAKLVPQYGYNIHFIKISGIVSRGVKAKLVSPFKVFNATRNTIKICKSLEPDAIICMGGYVCGPAGLAAKILNIPLILHEQNCVFGLTNKILKKIATRVLSAFNLPGQKSLDVVGQPLREQFLQNSEEQNLSPLLKKVEFEFNLLVDFVRQKNLISNNVEAKAIVNNPIFTEENYRILLNLVSNEEKSNFVKIVLKKIPPNLVSIGGSLGAKVLNDKLSNTIKKLKDQDYHFNVLQQVGKGNSTTVKQQVSSLGLENFEVREFIYNMQEAYYQNDIIVCRSGALTVFEIAQTNRFAIFIPYPGQKDQQQLKNTLGLQKLNACFVIEQKDLTEDLLAKLLISNSYFDLYQKAKAQTQFATPFATAKIVSIINEIIN